MRGTMKTALGATLALLLSGAASFAEDVKINIAGVLINTQDPFWNSIGCGAQTKATELGANLELFSATTMDAAAMSANFDAALLTNPNGFFGTPAAANQFVTQYTDLMNKGVPVVTGNGTDPAAQYKVIWSSGDTAPYFDELLKLIPADQGKMVVLGGIPGLVPLESRYEPLVKALNSARPGLTEIERIYTTFDINKATSSVTASLIANPDLKVIIASNGPDGVGAAAAVKAAGLVGQVTIIAFDSVPPEIDALKDGTITALIAQSPAQIGAASIQALVDYIKAGHSGPVPVSSDFVGIPQRLLTKATVDDPANADYVYKAKCN
jgi:ribose transport system substrate-binding protein